MVKWTKEQEDAIYSKGSDILVAAAAGSGKTAVLVERMIQKLIDTDDPINIDELLVVTFTNAAAQEMRNRIGAALEKALEENPASNHLKKQLSLLQRAPISTLHSFCLEVIREHAYLLNIDPAFRIADEMEADLIKQDVIEELFEEWYGEETGEGNLFFAVIDRFSGDRSDLEVEELIMDLFTFAMQSPDPDKWLDSLSEPYNIPEDFREENLAWLNIMKAEIKLQFDAIRDEIGHAMSIAEEKDGPYQYCSAIEQDLEGLREAEQLIEDWDALQQFMNGFKFATLKNAKDCNEDKKAKTKKLRDDYKKRWNDMKDSWFTRSLSRQVEDMRVLAPVVAKLADLVKQFIKRFEEQKREKALVDFSDLEHFCLRVLTTINEQTGERIPSETARGFQSRFKEVLIDEYQDVNLVQETIVSLISDKEGAGNRFMVGDVKQSIYRFRHAEPGLFIGKYKRFAEMEDPGKRIDLASNFRSRKEVLIGANYIFRQVLDEELGEIAYDKDAELIYANKMYEVMPYPEPSPELVIIDREKGEAATSGEETGEETLADLEKAQLEARAYGERIKEWIGHKDSPPLQVTDKSNGSQRDLQYRDIVILLRSMTWAPQIADELKQLGIPVYAEISSGYFAAIEIKVMINLLKIIDNPRQDIPLASVLKSPIIGLNEDELARVRLADRKNALYDAVHQYMKLENDETAAKLSVFMEKLSKFRMSAKQGALADLIWEIYRETGFYDFAGGMPGGRQRQANLRALYDRARSYERTSFRGLYRFLRFIERMEERGDDLGTARALSEQEDVVRIMTIHKSKGLEFPVVIVGAMDKQFNMQDLRMKHSLHKDLGFAMKYIDPGKRIIYPTLFYQAMNELKKREMLAEEMRVLYVALTRAKEKLLMVGNVNSFEKKRTKWLKALDEPGWVLPVHLRASANSYMDWVAPALARHEHGFALRGGDEAIPLTVQGEISQDPSKWKVTVLHASELSEIEKEEENIEELLTDQIKKWKALPEHTEKKEWVDARLSYVYPYSEAAVTRAKQSVTEIKRQREIRDEYSGDQLVKPFRAPIAKRPKFMQEKKELSAAERGTALHTVMQHIPLDRNMTTSEIMAFAEELVTKEILTEESAEAVDYTAIEQFFQTDIGKMMLSATQVQREIPFSLSLPAEDVYAKWTGDGKERVLVQGIIDCAIPAEDGSWIILDYKTDEIHGEITPALEQKLWKRYATQLELYKTAIEQIWKIPVKEVCLYFFSKQMLLKQSL
ncbi:helicase-exonuclease AddAB subunit AddA [Aciduricibacillus chroicocephali]|uniref:ATP-dependent helicase/nuclease subunit A n=1 Tax=Aciduricibacillus chroicocephali TaxID=3054939 RepID=A0ABY9KXX7_9BACI|nr:helicase-exonuclease AddAB subunit AddA [Bacillaceae bacterium 44XB]